MRIVGGSGRGRWERRRDRGRAGTGGRALELGAQIGGEIGHFVTKYLSGGGGSVTMGDFYGFYLFGEVGNGFRLTVAHTAGNYGTASESQSTSAGVGA